jgi:hypothetical protein
VSDETTAPTRRSTDLHLLETGAQQPRLHLGWPAEGLRAHPAALAVLAAEAAGCLVGVAHIDEILGRLRGAVAACGARRRRRAEEGIPATDRLATFVRGLAGALLVAFFVLTVGVDQFSAGVVQFTLMALLLVLAPVAFAAILRRVRGGEPLHPGRAATIGEPARRTSPPTTGAPPRCGRRCASTSASPGWRRAGTR